MTNKEFNLTIIFTAYTKLYYQMQEIITELINLTEELKTN